MTRKVKARKAKLKPRGRAKAGPAKSRPRRTKKPTPAPRFIHLGDRLLALERVRAGVSTVQEAAREVGVGSTEFRKWQLEHSRERIVSFAELRPGHGTVLQRLRLRARRLADLVAASERVLRDLHHELVDSVTTTSRPVSRGRRFSK